MSKVIIYKLVDGETPEYVINGGQFPKDGFLVGLAQDTATETVIATKAELITYTSTLEAPSTLQGENPTMAEIASAWWDLVH